MVENMALYEEVIKFHGHSCPGLAMGFRMTQAALEFLQIERPKDEELVAIVENDACGVDAVQYLSGCTFGKGNLIFNDFGKMVYTFYERKSKRAIRVSRKSSQKKKMMALSKEQKISTILKSSFHELFELKEVQIKEPKFALLLDTVICEQCKETVTMNKATLKNSRILCKPCYEEIYKN